MFLYVHSVYPFEYRNIYITTTELHDLCDLYNAARTMLCSI